MNHVVADIIEASEAAISAVPIVATVLDFRAVEAPPRPARGKAMVELSVDVEGPNVRTDGNQLPREAVIRRTGYLGARVTVAIPRDMTMKDLYRTVIAPIEVAMATCKALEPLCDDWFLEGIQGDPAQDSAIETYSTTMVWKLTYTTAAGAPGEAL